MELIQSSLDALRALLPLLSTVAIAIALLSLVNRALKRRWKDNPDASFRFQLIMLSLTFVAVLAVVVALPITDTLRGQLLSLIGIVLSAAIALSSTTFIGNVMAGIMLRTIRSARPGDFIALGDLTGRITESGLLHTEIQTEFRDLVTVPNLYMVTQPMKVVRSSGTIITTEVSLGYDVPNSVVADVLCKAAESAGLIEAFVHVRELGDFAVTYRVAGLLKDVQSLISSRSALRLAVLNALHQADIEIVSPTFMNTRAQPEGKRFIPPGLEKPADVPQTQVEDVAFDKAEQAASVEEIRKAIEEVERREQAAKESKESKESKETEAPDPEELERLGARKEQLVAQLAAAEKKRKEESED
jgi:small conductance mechanosensitive channel